MIRNEEIMRNMIANAVVSHKIAYFDPFTQYVKI
jgi:hypothetical protein